MKKDNFDLRSFLSENRLTENSRGDEGRYHFDGSQNNSGRARVLNEMRIPADGANGSEAPYTGDEDYEDDPYGKGLNEGDPYDHHDPDYDEDWFSHEGADMADDYNDMQKECGDVPSDRTNDTLVEGEPSGAKGKFLDMISYWTEDDEIDGLAGHSVKGLSSWGAWDRPNYDTIRIDGYPLSHYKDDDPIFSQMCADIEKNPDYIDMDAYRQDNELDECGDMDVNLDEAGYTDDDDMDFGDEDDMDMMDIIRKDKGAAKAKKAAQAAIKTDQGNDPDPADMDADADAPAIDPEDADAAAGETDPNATTQYGLASQVQHTPTVEFEMDDEELDEYLSQFRRPQVAVNVLNRAIRGAQKEVNDSALDSLYIILKNGFYETSRFQSGKIIAKVHKEQGAADAEA